MHHLIYSSIANISLTEAELQRQLGHWRTTNASMNITGLLLYSNDDQVLQVLEGEADQVHKLFAVIAADIRHRSVVKLADGPVLGRAFASWSMRFRTLDATDFTRLTCSADALPDRIRNLMPLLEAFVAEQPLT